jgi:hypothetical protein
MLASFKWQNATVNTAKYPLLTSDRPIIMSNGLIQPDAHIVLPISPRRLFIATKNDETFQSFREMNPNELAQAVNNQVSQQAHKFVFDCDESQTSVCCQSTREASLVESARIAFTLLWNLLGHQSPRQSRPRDQTRSEC